MIPQFLWTFCLYHFGLNMYKNAISKHNIFHEQTPSATHSLRASDCCLYVPLLAPYWPCLWVWVLPECCKVPAAMPLTLIQTCHWLIGECGQSILRSQASIANFAKTHAIQFTYYMSDTVLPPDGMMWDCLMFFAGYELEMSANCQVLVSDSGLWEFQTQCIWQSTVAPEHLLAIKARLATWGVFPHAKT